MSTHRWQGRIYHRHVYRDCPDPRPFVGKKVRLIAWISVGPLRYRPVPALHDRKSFPGKVIFLSLSALLFFVSYYGGGLFFTKSRWCPHVLHSVFHLRHHLRHTCHADRITESPCHSDSMAASPLCRCTFLCGRLYAADRGTKNTDPVIASLLMSLESAFSLLAGCYPCISICLRKESAAVC